MYANKLRRLVFVTIPSLLLLTAHAPGFAESDISSSIDPTVAGSVLGIGAAVGAGFLLFNNHSDNNHDGNNPQPTPSKSCGPVVLSSNDQGEFTNSYLQVTPAVLNGVAHGQILIKNTCATQSFTITQVDPKTLKPIQDSSISLDGSLCNKNIPTGATCNIKVSFTPQGYTAKKPCTFRITGSSQTSKDGFHTLFTSSLAYNTLTNPAISATSAISLPNVKVDSLSQSLHNGVRELLGVSGGVANKSTNWISQKSNSTPSLAFIAGQEIRPGYHAQAVLDDTPTAIEYQIGTVEGGEHDGEFYLSKEYLNEDNQDITEFRYSSKPFAFAFNNSSPEPDNWNVFLAMYDPNIGYQLYHEPRGEFGQSGLDNADTVFGVPDGIQVLRDFQPKQDGDGAIAVTDHGTFELMTDDGVHYFAVQADGNNTATLATSSKNATYIVVRENSSNSNQAIWVREHGSVTFKRLCDIPAGEVASAFYFDLNTKRLHVGTRSGKNYETQVGDSSNVVLVENSAGLKPGLKINQFIEFNGKEVIASDGGLYAKDPSAKFWVAQSTGLGDAKIAGLAPRYGTTGTTIFAAANASNYETSHNGLGIYASTDKGANWFSVTPTTQNPKPLNNSFGNGLGISAFFADFFSQSILVGLDDGAVFRSADLNGNQISWTKVDNYAGKTPKAMGDFFPNANNSSHIIFSAANPNLQNALNIETHASTTDGQTWKQSASIPANGINAFSYGFQFTPSNQKTFGTHIFAATKTDGVWKFIPPANNGVNQEGLWVKSGLSGKQMNSLSQDGFLVFAGGNDGIYETLVTNEQKPGAENWKLAGLSGRRVIKVFEEIDSVFAAIENKRTYNQQPASIFYSLIEAQKPREFFVFDPNFIDQVTEINDDFVQTKSGIAAELIVGTANKGIYTAIVGAPALPKK